MDITGRNYQHKIINIKLMLLANSCDKIYIRKTKNKVMQEVLKTAINEKNQISGDRSNHQEIKLTMTH